MRFAELLEQAGADSVWIDDEGDTIALRSGSGGARTIMLGGHLDTVFPEGTDVTPLVQRTIGATQFMGGEPYLDRSSTNSNIPIFLGIPAVTLGRGGIGVENHSPGEWWINEDAHLAIQRALLVVLAEAGTAPGPADTARVAPSRLVRAAPAPLRELPDSEAPARVGSCLNRSKAGSRSSPARRVALD